MTRGYSHATFNPPPSSRHAQLAPSTRVTQAQLGLSAHSVSQLHAPPPLAFSSQYQPAGQMPLPHLLQVPSSQLTPLDFEAVELSLEAVPSSSCFAKLSPEPSPESSEFWEPSAADLSDPPAAVPPPHWGSSKTRARQLRKGRILLTIWSHWAAARCVVTS